MNWEKLFDEERLIRGYDYFLRDKVFDVIITDKYISSKVEGKRNNIYEVQVNFDNDEINSLYCTCPYSYSKTYCKHMVATLYKLDEINQNKNDNINKSDSIFLFKDVLKDLDENKLKKYLYDNYKDNEEFTSKFINEFYSNFTYEDYLDYENMLNNIFKIDLVELYNENGFYQESPYHRYLINFINTKINSLYDNEHYNYVLQLIYSIYENIAEKENISDYLNVEDILSSCNYYLENIIDLDDMTLNVSIYDYILSNLKYNYDYNITPNLVGIAVDKNISTSYLKQLDEAICSLLKQDIQVNEDLLLYRYRIMNKLSYPINDLNKFLYDNRHYYKIMDLLINKEITSNNLDTAILLLNENREIHGKLYSLEDTSTLIDLYIFTDNYPKAVSEIKNIIFEFDIQDITYINLLKQYQSSEEWKLSMEEIIRYYSDNNNYNFLNQIYVNEGLYDKLYVNIRDNCLLDSFDEYKEYLDEKYHDEILILYKKEILEQAKTAKYIGAYNVIVNYLTTMLGYTGSKDVVEDTIGILKNKYKNKQMLMELLNDFQIQLNN
ncbi:MAG: SWIM zinc finger family protein [Methanosphaera sp.]|nr:SWIM zinc finger family protein [Methanosphaera sp.]